MRDLSGTKLEAAQQASSLEPVIKIVLTQGEDSYTLEEDRLLDINHIEEPDRINAKDTQFDNSDGYFTSLDLKGYKVVVSYGLVTKDGKEYSATSPMWVTWQQLDSTPGKLTCQLTMLGIPDLMDRDEASASYLPEETDTKTVKTLLREIAGDSGVTHLACFNHTDKYDMVFDSEDDLVDSYMPKDSFRIYVGVSRWAAFKRLLEYTGCVQRIGSDGKIHIMVPTTTGTVYDYEYSLESGHTFFSKAYRKSLVIPNYIVVQSQPDDDPQYSGSANDAVSYALLPKRKYYQTRLQSNDEAGDIASAILGRAQLNSEMGAAEVPMNCGAELYDYVKVTDERESDFRIGNLGSIARKYKPGQYSMRFTFGDPPIVRHIKELYQDIKRQAISEGEDFERLIVKDLYAENIMADNIDMIWLDPEGNIDLSQIGDDLDGLPDGENYAKVKSLHLDAGQIKLDENIFYSNSYDPSEKRRTFHTTPTTPYDLGDMWFDGSVAKRCTTARATGDYVPGDWTEITIDELEDGVTYQRAKSAALTAAGMVILDQLYIDSEAGTYDLVARADISAHHVKLSSVVQTTDYRTVSDGEKGTWNGKPDDMDDIGEGVTYQRVLATDISAGHIKLTSAAVVVGEWYKESGVVIDATKGIGLYGGQIALKTYPTLADYEADTNVQCYVGTDGKMYAGGGDVVIDANGLSITRSVAGVGEAGKKLKFYDDANNLIGQVSVTFGGSPDKFNVTSHGGGDLELDADGSLRMYSDEAAIFQALSGDITILPAGNTLITRMKTTPVDVSGSKSLNTYYQNTSNYPIIVVVTILVVAGNDANAYIDTDGSAPSLWVAAIRDWDTANSFTGSMTFLVPDDYYYTISCASGIVQTWYEFQLGG